MEGKLIIQIVAFTLLGIALCFSFYWLGRVDEILKRLGKKKE